MNNEIQNLINEKTALNNTIKLRRQRHDEEINKLKQEYFLYENSGNKYRSTRLLNKEIEEANNKFENNLKQEFEKSMQEKNKKLNDEKIKLTEILSDKTEKYASLMRELRNSYMQGPMVMPNIDGLRKEIEDIQRDIRIIDESINANGISINEQTQQGPQQQGSQQQGPQQQGPQQQGPEQQGPQQQGPQQQGSQQQGPQQQGPEQQGPQQQGPQQQDPQQQGSQQQGPQQQGPQQQGQPETNQNDSRLKIKIGGIISTERDGNSKTVGMSYYTEKQDERYKKDISALFKNLGFDDKDIEIIFNGSKKINADMNVMRTLLESSKNGEEARKYLVDYFSVLKGDYDKLKTFDLEYNLKDKANFEKEEWKKFKQVALDSRKFAQVKGKTKYIIAMKIAGFKPIRAITWPFRKVRQAIQGRNEMKRISDGKQHRESINARLAKRIELAPPVEIDTKRAIERTQKNMQQEQNKDSDERQV